MKKDISLKNKSSDRGKNLFTSTFHNTITTVNNTLLCWDRETLAQFRCDSNRKIQDRFDFRRFSKNRRGKFYIGTRRNENANGIVDILGLGRFPAFHFHRQLGRRLQFRKCEQTLRGSVGSRELRVPAPAQRGWHSATGSS